MYAKRLLDACAAVPGQAVVPVALAHEQPLAEPLTPRELEVLRLLATGLSNAEIAERLVITVGTAKRHVLHIYSKIDVRSRAQAIVKARQLGLAE